MKAAGSSFSGRSDDLVLQVTPPRMARHLIERERLMTLELRQDYRVILIQAPAGFGKTSLLLQWRQKYLSCGTVVAWVSAQARQDPSEFLNVLMLSVQQSAARPNLGRVRDAGSQPLEIMASWLAQLVHSAMDVILIIDEADRLSSETRALLVHLLRSAPPNLRVILAARSDMVTELDVADLVEYGHCQVIRSSMLRFNIDETIALTGERMNRDAAVSLHELVGGWPLGLQHVTTAMLLGERQKVDLDACSRALHEPMVRMFLADIDPVDLNFLERIAILDRLQPELCRAVTQDYQAIARLTRLVRDKPMFVYEDDEKCLRMHKLIRDALRSRLSPEEQAELHARAATWLEDNSLLEAAGRHALLSGKRQWAYDLAERSLYDDLMAHGRHDAVLEWLDGLPFDVLDTRPHLMITAAWAFAASGRSAEGSRLAERILARNDIDEVIRCECTLILGAAAAFSDDPDLYSDLVGQWVNRAPGGNAILSDMLHSMAAFRDILLGLPAFPRLRQKSAESWDSSGSYAARWGEYVMGLAYLREGQLALAERQLRVTLALAEADFGRRSPFACMVAAVFGATLYDMGRSSEAIVALANRLDILDKFSYPEPIALAYRTLTRIAFFEGKESVALQLQNAMYAVGVARDFPSLCIMALTEQVKIHSRRFRAETCAALIRRLEEYLDDSAPRRGTLWRRDADLQLNLARAYAAIAGREWQHAMEPIARGDAPALLCSALNLHIEFLGLRALVLDRCGEDYQALLSEALDLEETYGFQHILDEAHPAIVDLIHKLRASASMKRPQIVSCVQEFHEERPKLNHLAPSAALTPKEREVLVLLAQNFSNKEIGLAMQVSEQTIKWHIKNLFVKLDVGTRKQVVDRSRMLGLLQENSSG